MKSLKNLAKGLFDEDKFKEAGKGIFYSLPVAYATATLLQGDAQDTYAHIFASAGLAGYTSEYIEKRKPKLAKYSRLVGSGIAAAIMIGVWEPAQEIANLSQGNVYGDIMSDGIGVANYLTFEGIRKGIKKLRR